MVRYSLLRLLIFFGFLFLFWLIGLRGNPVLLLGASAIASAAASYVLLRGMRDEMTAKLVERHETRLQAKADRQPSEDELAEDAEIDAAGAQGPVVDEEPPAERASDTTGAAADDSRNADR